MIILRQVRVMDWVVGDTPKPGQVKHVSKGMRNRAVLLISLCSSREKQRLSAARVLQYKSWKRARLDTVPWRTKYIIEVLRR